MVMRLGYFGMPIPTQFYVLLLGTLWLLFKISQANLGDERKESQLKI